MATNNAVNNGLSGATGTGSFVGSDSPTFTTQIDVDNLRVSGNTISSTNTNGNIVFDPNGLGDFNVTLPSSTSFNAGVTTFTGSTAANTYSFISNNSNGNVFYLINKDTAATSIFSLAEDSTTTATPFNIQRYGSTHASNANLVQIKNNNTFEINTTANNANIKIQPHGTGEIVITKGIQFPATAVSSSNANTLDDYEEGDWTPVIADAPSGGNTAGGTITGSYTKIGNIVTVAIQAINVDTTGMTGGNDLFFRSLPFTIKSGSQTVAGSCVADTVTFGSAPTNINALGSPNNTYFRIGETISAATINYVLVSEVSSGVSDFYITLTYFV